MKLTKERAWWLTKWDSGGWLPPHGMYAGFKKWDAHTAALVKAGLLETDEYGLCRITDAGRRALSEQKE